MGTTSSSIDISTTNYCAACGKEGPTNTCNKCNMVKYCNAACKKKHRSKHKKACEKRVAELQLFKDHPPREDCPICFQRLPFNPSESVFHSCCGKIICDGCIYAMDEEARGRGGEGEVGLCAFCRTPRTISDEEIIKQLQKLMKSENAHAFFVLGVWYATGDGMPQTMGLPQDYAKANELWMKAGKLGCGEAYNKLGNAYYNGRGVEVDNKKAKHYFELAAMNWDVHARYNLGCMEENAGNIDRAYKHYILAARAGYKDSLDRIKEGFTEGFVTKEEYENTIRAYQSQQDEMKSDDRDKASKRPARF